MKPILFNTEMVRAILDGRKTVTRRVVKPANPFRNCEGYRQGSGLWIDGYNKDDEPNGHIKDYSVSDMWWRKENYIQRYAPFKVNDILYVRETWTHGGCAICQKYECYGNCGAAPYLYKADFNNEELNSFKEDGYGWSPSIHMPKEAARIFLRVTSISVEQLQEITRSGMKQEGIKDLCGDCKATFGCDLCLAEGAVENEFMELWDSTIKKDQLQYYGWNANPYVWVIEFEVIDKAAALKEGQT